ncbi:hypothetical protein [Acinetobacter chengduensis]|uniref:DUF2612 domain-containing protein n=1 Tax=Acinetobacter chengduensis TaxID=2420890 RepID=A0ABX9TTK1_9GAMM|nr:hypothetical protein [Acinetobacter chengduensis]RLL18990.1 hypothetical protein D9K81_14630 [Acinetobacter chengduensis]
MDKLNLLEPLSYSHTYTELEQAMQQVFIKTYIDLLGDDLTNLFDYSVPHMAGGSVVERFSKKDGLVVLRRPNISEALMRVIYANWISMGSKRGLAFLDFVLRMLWPGQYKIKRLFHSKALASSYPSRLTYTESSENFLTSRIHISMDDDVDLQELTQLAPTLTKLVPANVVPSIAVEAGINDLEITAAVGVMPMLVCNFEPL